MTRKIYVANLVLIVISIAIGLYFIALTIYPWKIVKFDSDKIELLQTIVKPGEVMPMKYPFTKYVNIFPTIHRRIVNEVVYQLPTMQGSVGKGRMDKWVYSLVIPSHLPTGRYKIIIDFVFRVNFTRDYTITISSDYFLVMK
jgi:hypothetical protein